MELAKDNGKTAIDDDCKIPTKENMQQKDTQVADEYTFSDDDIFDNSDDIKLYPVVVLFPLYYKQGELKPFKAKPFKRESPYLQRAKCNSGINIVDTSKETLELLQEFCDGYAKIEDENANCDDEVVNDKLTEFDDEFVDKHWRSAIELAKVAFDFDMLSLVDLMMEGVDRLFMEPEKTEDEVYDLLFVNLKEPADAKKFEDMKNFLNRGLRDHLTDDDDYWDPELLKMTFSRYKALPSYEDQDCRRQWLLAHFLLRSSPFAWVTQKRSDDIKRRSEDEPSVMKDLVFIDIKKKIKWKRKFPTSFHAPPVNAMETSVTNAMPTC